MIAERYDRNQPLVLTSKKAFSDWGQVLANDPIMASAALDRPLHRSTVIHIRGDSYCLREKRRAGAQDRPDGRGYLKEVTHTS